MERGLRIEPAAESRVAELAELAGRTFPLACPPSTGLDDITAFVAESLSAERFRDYLRDPDRVVLTATQDDRIIGYAMTVRAAPEDPDVAAVVTARPAVELSKFYVAPEAHGHGAATRLMATVLAQAADSGAACVWLGVNQKNQRAQRFYIKHGFTVTGTKTFRLGAHIEHDYVMARPV